MPVPAPSQTARVAIDDINGPSSQGQEKPDEFTDLNNPISSTDHGLSNYEANYPDGCTPTSGQHNSIQSHKNKPSPD